MSLRPFTFPLPETRFLHAGRLVYKFRIRYGNFTSAPDLGNSDVVGKELEEVIRVILGNLDDLHPFSTHHFTVFPYLSRWERVSKMRFRHENIDLVPYPYVCTMYVELNSFQQNISGGQEVKKGRDELIKKRKEVSGSAAVEDMVKRRVAVGAERMDRPGAERVPQMRKAQHGLERDPSKEKVCELSPASLAMGCPQGSSREPMESNLGPRTATGQAEGTMQLLQPLDLMANEGNVVSAGRGLSKFWRSIIFSPLQRLFGGKH